MSLSELRDCACPSCGNMAPLEFWANLDRDMREDILSGTLQRRSCASCGAETRFPPTATYLDPEAGLWVAAKPSEAVSDWVDAEQNAADAFEAGYGTPAPPLAQEIGKSLRTRLTFGWPALREKLVLSAFGLDDVTAELVKLVVLRDRPDNPLAPGTDLRVTDKRGPVVELAWINAKTGAPYEIFETPLALFEALKDDPTWDGPRATLISGLFVDINRFLTIPKPVTS